MTSNWLDSLWTQPVVERFKELLKITPWPGYTTIAVTLTEEFGVAVTKNACVGKARRDGLAPKLHPVIRGERGEFEVGKPIVRHAPRMQIKQPDKPVPPPKINKVTIWQLEPHHCRWPHGDNPPYLYCGRPKFADCSYCFTHARIAFPAVARAR